MIKPLESAVDYTVSLLHFDGDDDSTTITDEYGKTWTASADAKLKIATKKFGASSLYTDGVGDCVYTASHADLDMGTGDFTIDFWANPGTQTRTYPFILCNDDNQWRNGTFTIRYHTDGADDKFSVWMNNGSAKGIDATHTSASGSWHHVAVTRTGATLALYVNGVAEGTVTINTSDSINLAYGGNLLLGYAATDYGSGYVGYIDEFRISKGIVRWTEAFTPPTAAY